ncbi:Indoleamine 2,3-dioxygenase 1 [Grifola frondosa]|uniref:Indoleamine 2,3-dioxygenase 1 n=1 Tax=Grifola frondosa TaxID=5627 RepID=A0A1C7M2A6_GRIFR|nr:Indoleamine 2,3-dioxygenase 1 [Grifola frondosa]
MRLLQRAHMVLASVLHYYAHSIPPAEAGNRISIPRPLAVPLVEISNALGLPPVLTFADIVLWNWDFINPDLPLSVDNMRHLVIFSGTTAEDEFYHASAAAELKGVEMLKIMEGFMNMPNLTDRWAIAKVARDLERLKKIIEEIEVIVQGSRETVDPHIFYWLVRPWWSGSEERSPWVYEGVPDCPLPDLDGPSAGQSSVMHALDLFLDVDHTLQKKRQPAPSAQNRRADQRFMERMRRYMPRQHRDYLSCIAARSIRQVAERTPSLKDPYNAAVAALKKFRDGHIRIAVLYVVTMANSSPPAGFEHRAKRHGEETGPARGSGGTEVSNLLKAGRDATQRTLLK